MASAIFFAPDAYVLEGQQIMGRRTAGMAFLRAAVEGREADEPVTGYGLKPADRKTFEQLVTAIDPSAPTGWIRTAEFDRLARIGSLFWPGPDLAAEARLRLRAGPASYSLCGVTHTISTVKVLDSIAAFATEPVMPWDALICTSAVAEAVVRDTLEAALDQLRWRIGGDLPPPRLPQLPVIPLGVHCRDWAPSDVGRQAARTLLGLGADEIAILFAGRLSFAGKAHPFQMFDALRQVAAQSGQSIVLVQAGQYLNEAVAKAYDEAFATCCPDVRLIHADGVDADRYAAAYAGADIFLSLADNNQETFGITPVEAMAAGLPVIVSDWNGYRDTVRDGIDGFRIHSWAPAAGAGGRIGLAYQADGDFEIYSSRTSTTASVDMISLVARLSDLAGDPALRRRMGGAGRARALADYDWAVVYRRYRALWAELSAMRQHALADPGASAWLARAPKTHAAHPDPFGRFASYPTELIDAETMVRAMPSASRAAYEAMAGQRIFARWQMPADIAERLIAAAAEPISVAAMARHISQDVAVTIELVARLAKMNLVALDRTAPIL